MKIKTVSILLISIGLIGCGSLQPANIYKPQADLMGPEKVMRCMANAQYFQEKGKNQNTDFGPEYLKPYSTQKWQTARLIQQFYFNIALNYSDQVRNKFFYMHNQPKFFTKEIADECQKGFDTAPQNLKNDAFDDAPFFSDPQKISIVCTATGNSIGNLESAILYFKRGVVNSGIQSTFGTCFYRSSTKPIRDFYTFYDLNGKEVRFIGSYWIGNQLYFSEITQFDKYSNVSYFPDPKK